LQPAKPSSPPPRDDGDSASLSSYETGRETLESGSDVPTVVGVRAVTATGPPQPKPGHGLAGFVPPPPPPDSEKRGTELSVSTDATDSTSQPHRRKSVRMALPPSVSSTPAVTPAALEDRHEWPDPEPAPTSRTNGIDGAGSERQRRSRIWSERDVWAEEDSDEGGEYGEVRKALEKATRALETAGDLTKKERRNGHH